MPEIINVNDTADLPTWQKELANAVKNPLQLLEILEIEHQNDLISQLSAQTIPNVSALTFCQKDAKRQY